MRAVLCAEFQPLAAVRAAVPDQQHRQPCARKHNKAPDRPWHPPWDPVLPEHGVQQHQKRQRDQHKPRDARFFKVHIDPLLHACLSIAEGGQIQVQDA